MEGGFRRGSLVGPLILVGIGVLLLLSNLGLLGLDVWPAILRLWPALLIAIGIDLLIGRRSTWGALIALVLILAVFVGSVLLIPVATEGGPRTRIGDYAWDPEQIKEASIAIRPTWATVHVESLSGKDSLAEGEIELRSGERLVDDFSVEGETARLRLDSHGDAFDIFGYTDLREWDIGLTDQLPLDLAVQLPVGEVEIDLTGLSIAGLEAKVIIGRLVVTLPAEGSFHASIEGVIGETVILIPRGLPIRIRLDTGLAGITIPASLIEQGKDEYVSPTYADSSNRVELFVAHPIGAVRVREVASE